jgi:hypothetical protein
LLHANLDAVDVKTVQPLFRDGAASSKSGDGSQPRLTGISGEPLRALSGAIAI